MLIYHTAPVRCFPIFVEVLARHFQKSYHFRMPILADNNDDHHIAVLEGAIAYRRNLNAIPRRASPESGFPNNILRNGIDFVDPEELEDIDFLYGIFDGRLIERQRVDFVFTVISHPARHITDLFSYMSHVTQTTSRSIRKSEGTLFFDEFVDGGLEAFIDRFLDGDRSITILGRKFHLVDDFFSLNLAVDYDFVGVESNVCHAINVLSDVLGIDLKPDERLLKTSSIDHISDYRFDEVCDVLREQILRYEAALEGGV